MNDDDIIAAEKQQAIFLGRMRIITTPMENGCTKTETSYLREDGSVICTDYRLKVPTIKIGVSSGHLQ